MQAKIVVPVLMLGLLLAAPAGFGQNNRYEKKLKREVRKLEKQLEKVKELKDLSLPSNDISVIILDKHMDQIHDQQRIMKEQMKNFHFQQQEVQEQMKRSFEMQKEAMEKMRQQYPDGFNLEEIRIPDLDIDIDIPDLKILPHNFELDHSNPTLIIRNQSDNNLQVNLRFDNESTDKEYEFEVDDKASLLDMRIKGSANAGNLTIVLLTPDGNEYQKLDVSPLADVDWNQKIKIGGEENKWDGKWKIKATAKDAEGNLSVFMSTK